MKHGMVLIFLPVCVIMLMLPVHAADVDEILQEQERALQLDQLKEAANDAGGTIPYGTELNDGLNGVIAEGMKAVGGIARRAVRSGTLLMIVVLLCGFSETMVETLGKSKVKPVPLAGALAITAIAVADVNSMLGMGRDTIERITSFANVLLPTVAAVTAATGASSGAAVRQIAATFFSDLLVNLINGCLIPLLYAYLAAAVSYAALGNEGLKKMGALFKWITTTLLTVVMMVFVGYLSLSGVVAGSTDAVTLKAAKFAISGTIPVVGGILSDAAESILASAGILRSSVGVFGAVTVIGLCLVPVLRLAVHYLMYKLVAALSATVGSGRISGLVDQIGSAFGLLLGMTGACGLLLLISLVSSVSAVSI